MVVATRKQKQAVLDKMNPLHNAEIVQRILDIAGPGQWLFFAPVAKLWEQCCRCVPAERFDRRHNLFCLAYRLDGKQTSLSAVYASAERLELATACGLPVLRSSVTDDTADMVDGYWTDVLQRHIGKVAQQSALEAALALGGHFRHSLTEGVAASDDLAKLQWLCTKQGRAVRLNNNIMNIAAGAGAVKSLQWLQEEHGLEPDAKTMESAASSGKLATCVYLHLQGCAWNEAAATAAATDANCVTLHYLQSNWCPWNIQDIVNKATRERHELVVAFMLDVDPVNTHECLTSALLTVGCLDKVCHLYHCKRYSLSCFVCTLEVAVTCCHIMF